MDDTASRIYEQVADRVLELMERGELPPWHRPWRPSGIGSPVNAVSMKPYRGVNRWLTTLTQNLMGYSDPRWLTFKQAQSLGGHIRRGETSTQVVIWRRVKKKGLDKESQARGRKGEARGRNENGEENEEGRGRSYMLLRAYRVFNAEQTEECELEPLPEVELTGHNPVESAQAIIDQMPEPPRFSTYLYSDKPPHYSPEHDHVRVPEQGRYDQIEEWYNTVFHELIHSTGHTKRLNRMRDENWSPETHAYGREELVAGMGSAMLSETAGIGQENIVMDAAYVKHWSGVIRADRTVVVRAASLAQRAVDFILGAEPYPEERDEEKTSEKEKEMAAA